MRFKEFTFDKDERAVSTPSGRKVSLTKQQAEILAYFCEHNGHVIKHDELKNRFDVGQATIYTVVSSLRGIIGEKTIRTITKSGYKLKVNRINGDETSHREPTAKSEWKTLEDQLNQLSVNDISLDVLPGPNSGGRRESTWEAAIESYGLHAAKILESVICESDFVGVTFGRALCKAVELLELSDVFSRSDNYKKTFVPLWGQPIGPTITTTKSVYTDANAVSSSRLAAKLNRIVNGKETAQRQTLNAVPEFIPVTYPAGDLSKDEMEIRLLQIFEFLRSIDSYRDIFGPTDSPLIDQLNTIVTSAGDPDQPGLFWCAGAQLHGGIDRRRLRKQVVGDLGGALIFKSDDTDYARGLERRWTGVKLRHFQRCAEQAMKNDTPGVVLYTIGETRAHIVIEAIANNCVNKLLIDQHLALTIQRALDQRE